MSVGLSFARPERRRSTTRCASLRDLEDPAGSSAATSVPARRDQQAMLGGSATTRSTRSSTPRFPTPSATSRRPSPAEPVGEAETLARLRRLGAANEVFTSLIGLGYTGTFTPPVIARNVLENPAWYTAYTPYQPEISQGRLEALLNFQTMVADLTGMEIANASLLDEGTAAAEAMAMMARLAPKRRSAFFVDADCHPQTIAVVATRAEPLGIEVVIGDPERDLDPELVFGVLLQYPGSSGRVRDDAAVVERCHGAGALVTVATDLLALVLLRPPGELGVDIVVGSAQRFGVPPMFGGPARRLPRDPRRAQAHAARPAGRRLGRRRPAARRCGSRSRRVSSTSAARRRRATSAPRRCSSR